MTKRDALIIAHAQGRINRENLLRELEKLDCGTIADSLGERYPAIANKRKGDIVMAAECAHIKLIGHKV